MTARARLSHKLRDGLYRAKKAGCPVTQVTIADAESSGLLSEDKCHYCGCKLEGIYALEHKIPLCRKGPHSIGNLTKSCTECNQDKHIQEEFDYMASLGFEEMRNCE